MDTISTCTKSKPSAPNGEAIAEQINQVFYNFPLYFVGIVSLSILNIVEDRICFLNDFNLYDGFFI